MYINFNSKIEFSSNENELFIEFIMDHFGSLRKFAKYLGYSVSFVSAFINGKKAIPSYVVSKLFIDFGCDITKGHYPKPFIDEQEPILICY